MLRATSTDAFRSRNAGGRYIFGRRSGVRGRRHSSARRGLDRRGDADDVRNRRHSGVVGHQTRRPNIRRRSDLDAACELVAQARTAVLFLYPGDQHYFADSSLPSYDPEATALLTRRTLEFLPR